MIKKALKLNNVGTLREGVPDGPIGLDRCTLIHADNGRGKSMFAATIKACSSLDSGKIDSRRTIDCQENPEVCLLVSEGGQNSQLTYKDAAWSGDELEAVVFDSEFVEEDVYAGFEVRPDQRQSLLEFALGERTEDSGPWPCQWSAAQTIHLRVPTEPPPIEVIAEAKGFVAQAQLTTGEIQNLADEVANIVSAAVGHDLKFILRLEVDDPDLPEDVVERINEALAKVAEELRLQRRGQERRLSPGGEG